MTTAAQGAVSSPQRPAAPDRAVTVVRDDRPHWAQRGRVPFLDGLRALVIAVVICSQFAGEYATRNSDILGAVGQFGHQGVLLTFVISGFIFTLLLLREHDNTGTVSLRAFYIRRALRILPAFAAYFAAIGLLAAVGVVKVGAEYWLPSATFMMSYMPLRPSAWYLGHLWSLSVEEHFYLVWPVAFALLRPRRAWALACAVLMASPFVHYAVWRWAPALDTNFCSITEAPCIAIGCLLAYLVFDHRFARTRDLFAQRLLLLALTGGVILYASLALQWSWKFNLPLADTAFAAGCACLMLALLLYRGTPPIPVLNSRPLVALGLISYSLYLWQQLFCHAAGSYVTRFPVNILAAIVAATASYLLIEMPFSRLRRRLGVR